MTDYAELVSTLRRMKAGNCLAAADLIEALAKDNQELKWKLADAHGILSDALFNEIGPKMTSRILNALGWKDACPDPIPETPMDDAFTLLWADPNDPTTWDIKP